MTEPVCAILSGALEHLDVDSAGPTRTDSVGASCASLWRGSMTGLRQRIAPGSAEKRRYTEVARDTWRLQAHSPGKLPILIWPVSGSRAVPRRQRFPGATRLVGSGSDSEALAEMPYDN